MFVMKLLRGFLNVLLCIVMAIVITLAQMGIFGLIAAQSKKVDGVHITTTSENVSYWDAYGFWGTSVATACNEIKEEGPKYRVRNWFSWSWWKDGTKFIDTGIDYVVAVIKPVIVPIAEIDSLATYKNQSMNTLLLTPVFDDENNVVGYELSESVVKAYKTKKLAYAQLYEYFICYNTVEITSEIWDVVKTGMLENGYNTTDAIKSENTAKLTIANYLGDATPGTDGKTSADYGRWVRNNSTVYNHVYKLHKYNSESYDPYVKKFLIETQNADGTYSYIIKTPAVVLYSMIYISLILAIAFVICYPVALIQAKITGKRQKNGEDTLTA